MMDRSADGDVAANLLERRWFASITAARAMQAECELLREVMELAEDSWRQARRRLVRLEALRDALEEQLADYEGPRQDSARTEIRRVVSSAA